MWETLLSRYRNHLVCPSAQDYVFSAERKQQASEYQATSQRRRMSQASSLSDGRVALCQCLFGKAETKQDDPQDRP